MTVMENIGEKKKGHLYLRMKSQWQYYMLPDSIGLTRDHGSMCHLTKCDLWCSPLVLTIHIFKKKFKLVNI